MSLTVVTGAPGSGKTEILYGVARAAVRDSVPTVLLPSVADVRLAKRELVAREGIVGIQIESIDTFLATMWEVWGDGRAFVTPLQRGALLRAAVAESRLSAFTESSSTDGFLWFLERVVAWQSADPVPDGDDLESAISETLCAYREGLSRDGLVESAEATELLASRVSRRFFDGPILANRFDDLTAAQERFLVAAARAGAEVWLAITGEGERVATEATRETISRLASFADTVIQAPGSLAGPDELRNLAQGVFGRDGAVLPTGIVRLSSASGEEAEAERIAAEVLEAVESGIPLGEIAVLFRDSVRHNGAIRRAFAEASIPADYDARFRFSDTALGRAVLALLDFATTGSRAHLVAFLSSGYAGLRRDDVDELDSIWRLRPESTHDHRMLNDLDKVGAGPRGFVRAAARLAVAGVREDNVSAWKDLAGSLLANALGREAPLVGEVAADDARAHRKLCEAIDDLAELGDPQAVPGGLRGILARAWVAPASPPGSDRVQVMDVERARGRRFRAVIVGGLVHGEFPRSIDDGILEAGHMRSRLLEQGVQVAESGGVEQERLLFYIALTRATERLVLSRQETDSDGRPLRPSIFLEEVLAAYGTSVAENETVPERRLAFADLALHESAPALPRRALRSLALSVQGGGLASVRRARSRLAPPPDNIEESRVLGPLAARDVFSATELESYLACPYSWFYSRFLDPEPLGERGDALLVGRVVHAALREFYETLISDLGHERVTPANREECLALCDRISGGVLSREVSDDGPRRCLLADRVRMYARRLVSRDAEFAPGFVPRKLEWPFGLGDDAPEDFGGFALRGRVDRIDVAPGAFVVTDYKTGSATPGARFEAEGVLQGPLYAEVVRRRMGGKIAGTFYRSLKATKNSEMSRGAYDSELLSGPELVKNDAAVSLDEVVESAVRRAREAVDGIRAGAVPRQPAYDGACDYCGARSWCGEART